MLISLIGAKAFSKCTLVFAVLLAIALVDLGISFTQNYTYYDSWNETIHKNCTVNCTYTVTNGSFYGLSYEHGDKIWPLLKNGAKPNYLRDCEIRTAKISFRTVFSVLFAGVTGIMAGANVSGELKNPSKSIPRGTFSACFFTFVTYVAIFLATAMTNERNLLYHDCLFMVDIDASGGYIILGGALLVTFCACLNCLLGEFSKRFVK